MNVLVVRLVTKVGFGAWCLRAVMMMMVGAITYRQPRSNGYRARLGTIDGNTIIEFAGAKTKAREDSE